MDVTTSLSKFCLSQNTCNGHYFSWSVHWSNRFPWSLLTSDAIPASQYKDELERLCCLDGMHVIPLSYSCERRSEYIQDGEACVKAFLHCCKEIEAHREEGKEQSLILARSKSRQGLGSITHSMFQPSSKSKLVCEWMVHVCDQTGDPGWSRVHSCDTLLPDSCSKISLCTWSCGMSSVLIHTNDSHGSNWSGRHYQVCSWVKLSKEGLSCSHIETGNFTDMNSGYGLKIMLLKNNFRWRGRQQLQRRNHNSHPVSWKLAVVRGQLACWLPRG